MNKHFEYKLIFLLVINKFVAKSMTVVKQTRNRELEKKLSQALFLNVSFTAIDLNLMFILKIYVFFGGIFLFGILRRCLKKKVSNSSNTTT
jgi:hypothetical protein